MICFARRRVIAVQDGCFTLAHPPMRTGFLTQSPISPVDIYHLLGIAGGWSPGSLAEGGPVESNERYYRRRAVEERMAAQRAMTDTARAWHAKLAEDFAQRAIASTAISTCSQAAVAS
jgi:hypothetical protein